MAKRKSVNGKLPRHENPIPNASRIGNVIMSSVIGGTNPGTRDLPDSLEQQVANVFTHIRHDVEAAGATVDDIIKITFWVKNPAA
ncbi:RidA family protein, partial [Reyranella sp.]